MSGFSHLAPYFFSKPLRFIKPQRFLLDNDLLKLPALGMFQTDDIQAGFEVIGGHHQFIQPVVRIELDSVDALVMATE